MKKCSSFCYPARRTYVSFLAEGKVCNNKKLDSSNWNPTRQKKATDKWRAKIKTTLFTIRQDFGLKKLSKFLPFIKCTILINYTRSVKQFEFRVFLEKWRCERQPKFFGPKKATELAVKLARC